jgi:hypothetical protein
MDLEATFENRFRHQSHELLAVLLVALVHVVLR